MRALLQRAVVNRLTIALEIQLSGEKTIPNFERRAERSVSGAWTAIPSTTT